MDLENAEEILQVLERYTKQKSRTIPDELNGYLSHVAMTGDSVYSWPKVQFFFREKLALVLKDFHDTTPRTEGKLSDDSVLNLYLWVRVFCEVMWGTLCLDTKGDDIVRITID